MTDFEHRHAIREGEQNAASESYFTARPQIDTNDRRKVFQAGFERGWDRHAALVEAQQPTTHVQNPAEIAHVAGDVSKNGPESNMAQQPAPSAAAAHSVSDGQRALQEAILNRLSHAELLEKAHYLMELNSNQARTIGELQDLLEAAPQPSPTPQADSQPAPDPADIIAGALQTSRGHAIEIMRQAVDADRAARAPADSVTAPAGGEIDRLRAALVYVAYALHATPQYMLAEGITLIDGDTVRVSRDGWTVEASVNPARAAQPAQAADSVLEDAARLERERICEAIKAEDDYCVDHGDYMLDSDDCIKIVRGEWVRPDFAVGAARKQGGA